MLGTCPDSDVVVFPELCVTGYTCADLFGQARLLDGARAAIGRIAAATAGRRPARRRRRADPGRQQPVQLRRGDRRRRGARRRAQAVPAQLQGVLREPMVQPGGRQGAGGDRAGRPDACRSASTSCSRPAAPDGEGGPGGLVVGVEICEDLWVPVPPSALQAMAGATVLVNLSASNETIGKSRYRTDLVVGQSGRCVAAYAMAGCGPTESTTDVVFGGHCLIAENGVAAGGVVPGRRRPAGPPRLVRHHPRRGRRPAADRPPGHDQLRRQPLVAAAVPPRAVRRGARRWRACIATSPGRRSCPSGPELHRRCAEIFGIQCAGLAKRIEQLPSGYAAEHRHLGRAGFDALAAGRGDDLRHAGPATAGWSTA